MSEQLGPPEGHHGGGYGPLTELFIGEPTERESTCQFSDGPIIYKNVGMGFQWRHSGSGLRRACSDGQHVATPTGT